MMYFAPWHKRGPRQVGVILSGETLLLMFCGLGNVLKDYVVIS
jgi:hypothetical protein